MSALELFRDLADAAAAHAGGGLVAETDVSPGRTFLYTETHFALLLYSLERTGARPGGSADAAERLRRWDALAIAPVFFNGMAVSLLGIMANAGGDAERGLAEAVRQIMRRRSDSAEMAWRRRCGNNMYLQQLATDLVLAPLADGRPVAGDAGERLEQAFRSCMSAEGYFFDLPRPGAPQQREFPFTYDLKILFLLALVCRHGEYPGLERLFARGFEAVLPLLTDSGDFSYFGRTDRSTFAAGLAAFTLSAAASRGIGGSRARVLARAAERMFFDFPVGEDGCLEVNRFPLPSSARDRILSRDDYAYRWQYAIAGAAYCALGRCLFGSGEEQGAGRGNAPEQIVCSADLGVIRAKSRIDVWTRTDGNTDANDLRHAGPTVLRLEHAGRVVVGTLPKTVSDDWRVALDWGSRPALARHFDLLAYRWRHGVEALRWESAGFVPVLRSGTRDFIPARLARPAVSRPGHAASTHVYREVFARGRVPAWNHFADIAGKQIAGLQLRPRDPLGPYVAIELTREVRWDESSVAISDRITGPLDGKLLRIGTRLHGPCEVEVTGLRAAERKRAWTSDGPAEIQMYEAECRGSECAYRMVLRP